VPEVPRKEDVLPVDRRHRDVQCVVEHRCGEHAFRDVTLAEILDLLGDWKDSEAPQEPNSTESGKQAEPLGDKAKSLILLIFRILLQPGS
jgi:hypothetical protein